MRWPTPSGTSSRRAFPPPEVAPGRLPDVTPSLLLAARRALWAAGAPLLLVLTGCSGSSSPAAHLAASTAPAGSGSPSAAASTPPSPSAVATASAGAAPGVRAVDGDVDGDGRPDRVAVTDTTLAVTLSGTGSTVTAPVDAGLGTSEPAALAGSTDVDRDGHAEVFVRVGQGASTTTLRAFRFDGTRLSPVDRPDGPLLLVIGGSATHGDGFSCTDAGRLVVRSAASDDGRAFVVTTTTFRLSGPTAVQLARTVVHATGMDAPAVAAAYRVDCGPVGEGD